MAEITEFNIGQGESFRILLTITDTDSGVPLNLTDYTFTGQVRENYDAAAATVNLDITPALPLSSGSVYIGLTPAATLQLDQRKYVYDVNLITTATGITRRLLEGYLVVRRTATR